MNDSLAEALSVSYGRLKAQAPLLSDLDEKIKVGEYSYPSY
jgi:hypothetical protein